MTSTFAATSGRAASTDAKLFDDLPRVLAFLSTVGAGVACGVFFAFSTFVMAGLRRLPAGQGMAAMQGINKSAPTPLFMLVLFGTAVIALVAAGLALRDPSDPAAWLRILGAVAYLVAIGLTIVYHVPHNDALAKLDPNAPGSAQAWLDYARDWTRWNHVRTLGTGAATVLFALSLRAR
jgi:uncharacterized membrane protein